MPVRKVLPGQRRLLESILVAGLLNATKKDFFTVTYRD